MFWYRLLLALLAIGILSGCEGPASHGSTDLVPILCHRELGVGMLFVTVENRGNDAEPSTTRVEFNTDSPKLPRVRLEVKTPSIPSEAQRWVAVDLPFIPDTENFPKPVGKVMITVDAGRMLPEIDRKHNILVTNCNDFR